MTLTRDEMRPMIEWDSIINVQINLEVVRESGDSIICRKIERSEWFRLYGLDSVAFDPWIIRLNNGKIKSIFSRPNVESAVRMSQVSINVQKWADENRPIMLKELMSDGNFQYGTESAIKWLKLLREWRQETGQE